MPKVTTKKKTAIKKLPAQSTGMGTCPKCPGAKLQRIQKPSGATVGRCPRCRREYTATAF
tara:strand:+ start:40 stop:219 length:180 start_codon:yes stop_codon:yes gene_type:complete